MYLSNSCNLFAEADYTLDDSFWNEESPAGKISFLYFDNYIGN